MLYIRESIQNKESHIRKMKRCKKIFQADEKKAGLTIYISDKIDFKEKSETNNKEGHLCETNNKEGHLYNEKR